MLDTVLDVALKMKDPAVVNNYVAASGDLSLSGGLPGLVLLFSILERKGLIEGDISHQYVLKMKEAIEARGVFSLSLFSGVSGICFALQQASWDGERYQRMLGHLQRLLLENIRPVYIDPLRASLEKSEACSSRLYDVIQGLCGVGRYIVENVTQPLFYESAVEITKALVHLCQPLKIEGHLVPGWYLSPNDPLNARNKRNLKGGFNLGLAHGMPGILALFAIAMMRGVVVEGQKEAMTQMILWLRKKNYRENGIIRWPYLISWEKEILGEPLEETCKDAWCYGVPGIARTLFLAGKALQDRELKLFAVEAFRGVFSQRRGAWQLPGPMLCHGIAGLLMITLEMAQEDGCKDLFPRVDQLQKILLSDYDPNALFGFKDKDHNNIEKDNPGFLEGSTGILLTLLSIPDYNTKWALPLMIHE